MFLVGDIGGTKTKLRLVLDNEIKREQLLESAKYDSFFALASDFLQGLKLKGCCLALAGPVIGNRCKLTNLVWQVSKEELETRLGCPVFLLNDLEAMCYGVLELQESDTFVLKQGKKMLGNMAVIASGTGLGEAGIIWDGKKHLPFASEGGHVDFAPEDEWEMNFFRYLKRRYGHVSYERVVSGMGVTNIFNFLCEERKISSPLLGREDVGKEITEKAKGGDPICIETMERFFRIYGREAGNLALKYWAVGGVWIGGGIAYNALKMLEKSSFSSAFYAKGRFSERLKEIPLKVILNLNAPLLGALHFLKLYK